MKVLLSAAVQTGTTSAPELVSSIGSTARQTLQSVCNRTLHLVL